MHTSRSELEAVAARVHHFVAPTPQHRWPLLAERTGTDIVVKHENHTVVGAFKVRGGVVYLEELLAREPNLPGVIAATRGNHGQSVAFAAGRLGIPAVIVVPEGNSRDKNVAMRALGAEIVEAGHDFQAALEHAEALARERGLHMMPSFHPLLVRGVASYAMELFDAEPGLHTVYVPIGLGSGICGVLEARYALDLATRVVGVVAEGADAYARSFEAEEPVSTDVAQTFADGLACRVPHPDALEVILRGAERIVRVSEDEMAAAVRHYFTDTHNVAEGAGAAALAALLQERDAMQGRSVGVILSGGNVDRELFVRLLNGEDPPS